MKRFCLALDLQEDTSLIEEYISHHQHVWPEIIDGIRQVGIQDMQIYRTGNRMFMIIETPDDFDFEKQMSLLATLPRQQEWETLMWKYQKPLPHAKQGEKWVLMEKIFQL
ncbi:MAG: L-rhamnose mutarotase [Cytophagales bacterium]|nr:L-rhamnose mutarotase [Cytophagales bacterium]MDW8383625.1 L-rhamnose mutarotase [Flammeovirgaceae bacterium]